MYFDFELIKGFLEDYDIKVEINDNCLTAHLDDIISLYFYNSENETDDLFTFGEPWHHHPNDILFSDKNGYYSEFSYLDFLEEIVKGNILLCFDYINGKLYDIYPLHIDYISGDDLKLIKNEELRIQRLSFEKKSHNKGS